MALATGGALALIPASATANASATAATPSAPASVSAACVVSDASLTWGFKESFRSYISGSIAKGAWETAGGAVYETPAFTWSGGGDAAGDAAAPDSIGFTGSVRFTGHGGLLDTTIADPTLVVTGPASASLLLDITGTTQEGEPVAATDVPFATVDLTSSPVDLTTGGSHVIADAPAALTEEGAAAFGTYPAGEILDPLSASFTVACAEPVAAAAAEGPGPADAASDAGEETAASAASSSSMFAGPLLFGSVAAVAAGLAAAAWLLVRRRRATHQATPTSTAPDPEEIP